MSIQTYNAFLDNFSQRAVQNGGDLYAFPTKYGGCVSNAQYGIDGHEILSARKSWNVVDGGLENCLSIVSVVYNPTQSSRTNGNVVVTVTLSNTGGTVA
jgi:hypothetical protein